MLFRKSKRDDSPPPTHEANFYFYFSKDSKKNAESLEKELKLLGYTTDLHWLDYEQGQWSLTATKQVESPDDILNNIEPKLTKLSEKYQAEYDGHEIEV